MMKKKKVKGITFCDGSAEGRDCKRCRRVDVCGSKSGELVCVKKRVVKRYNPPDISAIKILLDMDEKRGEKFTELSNEILSLSNRELEKFKDGLVERILLNEK